MKFRTCLEARLEALSYTRQQLYNYLAVSTAFFCPQLAAMLVANMRVALKNVVEMSDNSAQGEVRTSHAKRLLKQTQITARFMTRSKRAVSFGRMVKLLTPEQRAEIKRINVSLAEVAISWKTSPKRPLSRNDIEKLLEDDQEEGTDSQLALTSNFHRMMERDLENLEASMKPESTN